MQKTTVYMPGALKADLERVARIESRSEAELIREGVRLVTQTYSHPEPQLPLFSSGMPGIATRLDEALEGFGEH